jgi:membrane-associated phospholipid phosphatase
MSDALLSARDAVTGFWDGLPDVMPRQEMNAALDQTFNLNLSARAVLALTDEELTRTYGITLPTLRATKQTILAHYLQNRGTRTPRIAKDDAYLWDIKTSSQAVLVDALLKSRVSFDGADGWCTIKVGGKDLIKLTRPNEIFFVKQLDWVRAYADLRGDRVAEVFLQLDDMASFFGAQAYLDSGRRKYSLMMLDLARSFSTHMELPAKYYCRAIRPVDLAAQVQPMIQTPDHSSFPSGHSTEAFAMATVFYRLMTGKSAAEGIFEQALPYRLAHRIAVNRTVAGVHYPVDSRVGAYLGCITGEYLYTLATGGNLSTVTVDPGQEDDDFLLSNFDFKPIATATMVSTIGPLAALWQKALAEW